MIIRIAWKPQFLFLNVSHKLSGCDICTECWSRVHTWSIYSCLVQTTGKLVCSTFVSNSHLRSVLACTACCWLTGRYLSNPGEGSWLFAKLSVWASCKQYPQKQHIEYSLVGYSMFRPFENVLSIKEIMTANYAMCIIPIGQMVKERQTVLSCKSQWLISSRDAGTSKNMFF